MKILRNTSFAVLSSLSAAAIAQSPEPPVSPEPDAAASTAEPPDDSGVAEVVVTAQRREEKLQDVPLAVTALTPEQIENRGIDNVGELSSLSPGLQVSKQPTSSTTSQIAIRGLLAVNAGIYWDSPVGVYVDGVYIGKAQGGIFDIVDLDRIEVLRGPQGTLYGRNTLAGAINLVTRRPSGVYSGNASVEVGNYDAVVSKASLDLPQMGIVRMSLAARQEQREGWVNSTPESTVDKINSRNGNSLRFAADFDFAPTVLGEYRFDRSSIDQTPVWSQLYSVDAGFTAFFYPTFQSYASTDRLKEGAVDAPFYERSHVTGHSFTLTWTLDDHHTIKSITGYRRVDSSDSQDLDGTPVPAARSQRPLHYDQTSQDLQWLGTYDRFNFVVGAYYFTDDGYANNPQSFFGGIDPASPIGAVVNDSQYGTRTDAISGYGQIDYRPMDALTLSAGIRYTSEDKGIDRIFGCYQSAFFGPSACSAVPGSFTYLIPAGTSPDKNFSATTPMASIAYRFNDNVNAYLRYAEGFKSGGFNAEYSNTAVGATDNISETETPFKPEKQSGFEVGVKTTSLDRRLLLNVAAFHNKAKDLQESLFLGGAGVSSVIRNAGEATIYGLELEGQYAFSRDSRIGLNYAYLHPEYDRFDDPASGTDQADNRAFPHAPKNSANVYVDALLARFDQGDFRGMLDYAYQSSFYTYAYELEPTAGGQDADHTKVDSFGLLNARLSMTRIKLGDSTQAEIAVWCRNVLDDDTANNFIDFGAGFDNLTIAYFNEPRTYGLTGIIRW